MIEGDAKLEGVEKARDALHRLEEAGADLRKIWPRMAEIFYEAERKQFESQGGRGSGGWAALAPRYAKWKEQHYPGQPILRLTGNLFRSLTEKGAPDAVYEARPGSLTLGTIDPKARAHQKGAGSMPSRPVIELVREDFTEMQAVATAEFEQVAIKLGFETTRG